MSPELVFKFTVVLGSVRCCGQWEREGGGDGVADGSQEFLFPVEAPQGSMH